MKKVKLGEVIYLNMGQSPESDSYNSERQGIPFFQGNADFGKINPLVRLWCNKPTKIAKKNDILLSVRAPIGAINIANCECCIGRGLCAITPREKIISSKYLYFGLMGLKNYLISKGTGSTFKAINKNILLEAEIPLPSLEEQKEIADRLDKVSSLIEKRKTQLTKLDQLIKSRFIEMFGEPLSNSNDYDLTDYGSLFELNAGGTPSKNKPEYWDNGSISWIGSNMCQDSILYENDGKYITELGFNNSSARKFPINTVLVALVGATIGKTALLKFETTTNQNVLGIRGIEESGNNPYFVFYYTQGLNKLFLDIGDGGFAMASKGFISKLPFPIVDISLQNEFAEFVKLIDKSKLGIQKSIEKLETLKKSLMQQYFG